MMALSIDVRKWRVFRQQALMTDPVGPPLAERKPEENARRTYGANIV